MAGSESVALEYLVACKVCAPLATEEPPQLAWNFTGIVLLNLNARTGSPKLPPVPFATSPPIGDKNPVKPSAARVTPNEQVFMFPEASTAVQTTVLTPTAKLALPEAGAQVTVVGTPELSLDIGAG